MSDEEKLQNIINTIEGWIDNTTLEYDDELLALRYVLFETLHSFQDRFDGLNLKYKYE